MFGIILIIVVGTTIWVGYDASSNKIAINDKPYSTNNGAVAWVLSCILLWIASFPYYLYKRSQIMQQRRNKIEKPLPSAFPAEEIAKYKKLFDDGAITKEEFEAKKQQLLGL